MKVILLRDVARLGRKSEIKDVPDGHALNFLIPRKLAIIATKENMDRVHEAAGKKASSEEAQKQEFKEVLAKHADAPITYAAEANDKGHLFKGIRAEDLVGILNAQGFTLAKQHVKLDAPIKDVGMHTIPLSFLGVSGTVQLEVVKK